MTAGHGKRNVSVIMIHITYLSVHIMNWFDAMCEEPFDAVAKVVVCVSEYDETNDLTQCVKKHFWSGKNLSSSAMSAEQLRFVCRKTISCLPIVTLQVHSYQRECLAFASASVCRPFFPFDIPRGVLLPLRNEKRGT